MTVGIWAFSISAHPDFGLTVGILFIGILTTSIMAIKIKALEILAIKYSSEFLLPELWLSRFGYFNPSGFRLVSIMTYLMMMYLRFRKFNNRYYGLWRLGFELLGNSYRIFSFQNFDYWYYDCRNVSFQILARQDFVLMEFCPSEF